MRFDLNKLSKFLTASSADKENEILMNIIMMTMKVPTLQDQIAAKNDFG